MGRKAQKRNFSELVNSLGNKLSSWKSHMLSQAKRSVLIKSCLASLPVYTMSTTMLPINIYDSMNKIQRDFWWGIEEGKKYYYLRTWNLLQLPTELGGLRFKDMHFMNQALIAKLFWRFIQNKDSLWAQVVSARYLKNNLTIWNAIAPNNVSPT